MMSDSATELCFMPRISCFHVLALRKRLFRLLLVIIMLDYSEKPDEEEVGPEM